MTTGVVVIKDEGEFVCKILRVHDGDSLGEEIINFLNSGKFVNGVPVNVKSEQRFFNGFSDFVAQLIAHLKLREGKVIAGGTYLYPDDDDITGDYEYTLEYQSRVIMKLKKYEIFNKKVY